MKWNKLTDNKPKDGQWVQIYPIYNNVHCAYADNEYGYLIFYDRQYNRVEGVTHWAPLLEEPPEPEWCCQKAKEFEGISKQKGVLNIRNGYGTWCLANFCPFCGKKMAMIRYHKGRINRALVSLMRHRCGYINLHSTTHLSHHPRKLPTLS